MIKKVFVVKVCYPEQNNKKVIVESGTKIHCQAWLENKLDLIYQINDCFHSDDIKIIKATKNKLQFYNGNYTVIYTVEDSL